MIHSDKLRSAAWKAFLLSDLSTVIEEREFPPPEDPLLPADVQSLLEQRSLPFSQLALLVPTVAFYYSARNQSYSPRRRLAEIALILRQEGGINDLEDLQWCLLSFCNRFVPEPDSESCLVDLFRQLIAYHDPQLLSLLESRKTDLERLTLFWLGTAFAGVCRDEVTASLWSQLFARPDPFFLLFVALSLLSSIGDQLDQVRDVHGCAWGDAAFTFQYPRSMELGDVKDCLMFADYFLSRTPTSFRDVYGHVFKAGTSSPHFDLPLTSLCLSSSARDVLASFRDESVRRRINYVFIDCRFLEDFALGHLRGSFHLSAQKLLEDPASVLSQIDATINSLRKGSQEHFCVIGYTDPDSSPKQGSTATLAFLSQLLKRKIPRVSFLIEGFRGIHDSFLDEPYVLEEHNPRFCPLCARRFSPGFVSDTVDKGSRIFDELKSTVKRTYARSKNSSFFSFIKSQYSSLSASLDSLLPLEFLQSQHDHCFEAAELAPRDAPALLCLSGGALHFYLVAGEGYQLYRTKNLSEIVRISTKAADSQELTLRFGRLEQSELIVEEVVVIKLPNPHLLVDTIKELIQSLY